jgi:hypothetical protein
LQRKYIISVYYEKLYTKYVLYRYKKCFIINLSFWPYINFVILIYLFYFYIVTISIMQTLIYITICMVSSLESTFHTYRKKFPRTSLVIRHVPPYAFA